MTKKVYEPDTQTPIDADLYKNGMHLFMGDVDESSCKDAIEFILKHNLERKKKPYLKLMICSNGGDVPQAFALIDVIKASTIPIRTVGLGVIASCGLMIFIAGETGHRVLTPNTSILSHQYSWMSWGKEHELFAQVKEFELSTSRMMEHYKKCTGLTEDNIRESLLPPGDVYLSAKEAKKLNLGDSVKTIY